MVSELQAKLKKIYSPDIPSLEEYIPDDSKDFGFLLTMCVGLEDDEVYEVFYVTVGTPIWYFKDKAEFEIIFGRHIIFVQEWNYHRLYNRLKQYVNSCKGASWGEVAEKVGRIAQWEFEDYQP